MSARLAQVVECDCCDGHGVVTAERIPSGAELDAGAVLPQPQPITCPVCDGIGARLVAA